MNGRDSRLLLNGNNYALKSFIVQSLGPQCIKTFLSINDDYKGANSFTNEGILRTIQVV